RATAILLASHSTLFSLAEFNATALKAVQDELQRPFPLSSIFAAVVDVRSQEACSSWVADTAAHFGQPIAGAFNLAGVSGPSIAQERGAIRHITDAEFDMVMPVNMLEDSRGHGGGAIINAASIAGFVGVEYNGPYVASKHAIIGLTRTAAKEEVARAIRINAIAPGIIATPMFK
ncbi:MAG: hypothetical protein Q9177_004997, partial [Variospora cf. flavescens]